MHLTFQLLISYRLNSKQLLLCFKIEKGSLKPKTYATSLERFAPSHMRTNVHDNQIMSDQKSVFPMLGPIMMLKSSQLESVALITAKRKELVPRP